MHRLMFAVVAIITTLFSVSISPADTYVNTDVKTKDLVACMKTALLPELLLVVNDGKAVEEADNLTEVQKAAFLATGHACVKKLKPSKVSSAP